MKHRRYLAFEKDTKTDKNLVELKFAKMRRFVNPKIEIEVFSYIICSLDFKNISCALFLLHMKTMNVAASWYILTLHHLFHFIACVSFLPISFFFS